MRILLAHKFYELTGGAEVFFRETERVLREAGHETLMVATGPEGMERPDNLQLLQAPNYEGGNLISKAIALPRAIYDSSKRRQMADLIAAFQPDLLHAFAINVHLSPSILDAAHDADIPVVATLNDYKHICPNYKLFHHGRICYDCKGQRFFNAARNRCCKDSAALSLASTAEAYVHTMLGVYRRIDHFTFSSDFMAGVTEEFWPDHQLSWSKLRNPFAAAAHHPLHDYEPYGLYFGRLVEEKGVDRLIEAAADINGFPIKIIGNGPEQARLEAMVARHGLANVEFLGPKWGTELDAILARARFVVVPSLWHENFPYVINQAFALARPVIGSRRGGIPELVADGERGLIFEPDHPGELSIHIRRLAQSDADVRRMGVAAKIYSDAHFNDAAFLAEVTEAYRRGVDAHHHRRR